MSSVELMYQNVNRHLETKSNYGQAIKFDRLASELEEDIRHLIHMQTRNIFKDIDVNGQIPVIIEGYTIAMCKYRTDANRLRRL